MNSPKLCVDVDAGQIIKISLVNVVNDEDGTWFKRDLWLEVKTHEDALINIEGKDLEIVNLWERNDEDELSEAEDR